ncbi:flavin-binding monooxygenase-like domain-containing protein [Sarocladium implicatum]|nr:flavin-binding monooxygenase-like domain-containing protein [Sarocladium implicatum]
MSKSVCIIGAGPSGLAAAKTFLHNAPKGQFKVTVVDAQPAIGGLWPLSKDDNQRQVHPLMVANQSRHTVRFSDLAWEKEAPQFPLAWQVGQYLQRYLDRYLTSHDDFTLRTGCRVQATRQLGDLWEVESSTDGTTKTDHYDHVVVATGFFGKPIVPSCLSGKGHKVPVIHSSAYRDLKGLLGNDGHGGRKILIVGGQMSGVEIAGTIGVHLSSAINSPDTCDIPDIESYSIHHVIQRPTWIYPLYNTPEAGAKAPPFLPIDYASYNRSNRPLPLSNSQGHITEEAAQATANIFRGVFGTDQGEFSPQLQMTEETKKSPQYLAVSDWYCDLVRSGLITLSTGKLDSLEEQAAVLSTGERIEDIAAVVVATGFDPNPCIDFLPEDALVKMKHSNEYLDHPLALAFHGTHHPEVPGLGFVGFYRSPYWGVIQMQSRVLARLWSVDKQFPEKDKVFKEKLDSDVSIQRTLDLRGDPRSSQFPMGDYPFLMQEMSQALSVPIVQPDNHESAPVLSHNKLPLDVLTPARYPDLTDSEEARHDAEILNHDTVEVSREAFTSPRFVSRAIFRSLLGTWSLERDLTSRLPSHPSGHFSGTAKFLIRKHTSDGLSKTASAAAEESNDLEYLYIEEGEFKTDNGFSFNATRRYVWRYNQRTDKISVWFVQPESLKRADYLFHEIELTQTEDRSEPWRAKAGHLCVDDYYDVKYLFEFNSINLKKWNIEYTVNGPKKDYTISGTYTRFAPKAEAQ